MLKEIETKLDEAILSDFGNIVISSIIGTALILAVYILLASVIWGDYKYKIEVGVNDYYCNEYIEEFNKLYLTDCSSEDTVIHNPTNYRIKGR